MASTMMLLPWLRALALLLASAVSNAVYLGFSSIIAETASWLQVSPGTVDSLVPLSNVGTFTGYLIVGWLIDRLGVAATFAAGVLVSAAGCALRVCGAESLDFQLLATGQFVANVGSSFLNALPAPLAVRNFSPGLHGVATALGNVGMVIGAFGGPLLGCAFEGQPAKLVWLHFVACVAVIPATAFFGGRCIRQEGSSEVQSVHIHIRRDESVCWRARRLFHEAGMVPLLMGSTAGTTVANAYPAALQQLACAVPGISSHLLSAILAVCGLVGPLAAGHVADRSSVWHVLVLAALLTASGSLMCFLAWMFVIPSLVTVGWVIVCLFGIGAIPVLGFVAAAQAVPAMEGTTSGMLNLFSAMGSVAAQFMITGVLHEHGCHRNRVRMLICGWTVVAWIAVFALAFAVRARKS